MEQVIFNSIGAAIAIGLSGVWVAMGQWCLTNKSIEVLGQNAELESALRILTILWMALVESSVIYGFIVAFQLLSADWLTMLQSIWAGLAIWVTWMWVWYGQGKLVSGSMQSLFLNPRIKSKIMQFTILFIALVESAAIYGLVVSQKIMW